MRDKFLKFVLFLAVWALIYWLSGISVGVVPFLLACLFVYSIGEESMLFLAREFDNNHNALFDRISTLQYEVDELTAEREDIRSQLYSLQDRLDNLEKPKQVSFDSFYDFLDDTEKTKEN